MSLSGGLSAGLVCQLSAALGGGGAAAAWNPGRLPGTPREWLAGPDYCFTDGSASFTAASSQFLSVASNAGLQTGTSGFWVAGWALRTTTPSGQQIIAKDDAGVNREYAVWLQGGSLRFDIYGGAGATRSWTSGASPTNAFFFWMAYYDPVNQVIGLSQNGAAFLTTAYTASPNQGTQPVLLGARNSGSFPDYFEGRLASVAFGKSPPGGIASVATTIRDRLYASGNGIVYADTTSAERTAWGLVSWWDLVRSGNFTDSHGSNNLTNNNGVGFGAGLPRARAGDTDPVSAWVDRFQGTLWSEADPLKRLVLRDLGGGRWVLRSDGVNDGIGHGPATTGARTIAMAYTQTVSAASTRVLQAAVAVNAVVSPRRTNNATIFVNGVAARNAVWSNDSNPHVFSMQRSGAGPWRAWGDGASLTVTDTTNNFGSLGVGHFTGADQAETFAGDIYSVVDTNADISDADRAKLTTYLAALYGGSL